MKEKTLFEIEAEYELELDKVEKEIKKARAKRVLLQFPDGLKPYSLAVTEELEKRIKGIEIIIWFGSCFGACDVPLHMEKLVDMIVQFGHTEFKK